ncbi:MAG: oligoribonuclease [Gammaproteobacteria bacterium]|nr:oligoribonuclease [Gammaproteobacteria bacterium]|tara:strand:+ start:1294 stop:1836 length:543 start_codon:yes stop_codon:yes gene_type:complete
MNADLVWIDLEMTGLDAVNDRIIEMATIITDSELNLIAEGPVLAIQQSQSLLDGMDEWNQTHHSASGLLERIVTEGVSEREAEAVSLAFIEQYVAADEAPLCGNSIWQDRRFLSRYMPALEGYLHYRMIDVSSVKELAKRWYPEVASGFKKSGAHTALADIRESIEELRYYRRHLFKLPS